MFCLRKLVTSSPSTIRAMSTYKRTPPLSKGFNIHWENLHIKEKVISTEKALAVLVIGALAIALPSPSNCVEGVTEVDCLNNFEEPFDSHWYVVYAYGDWLLHKLYEHNIVGDVWARIENQARSCRILCWVNIVMGNISKVFNWSLCSRNTWHLLLHWFIALV